MDEINKAKQIDLKKKAHGIIAISKYGKIMIMELFNNAPEWLDDIQDSLNELDETNPDMFGGLYYCIFRLEFCGEYECKGYPCAGDCGVLNYDIVGKCISIY